MIALLATGCEDAPSILQPAADDARDIRFVRTTGTGPYTHQVLPYEVETYNEAISVASFHVKIPSVPASGTVRVELELR